LLTDIHANCYAGVWVWPYFNLNDSTGQWSDAQSAVRALADAVPDEVQIVRSSFPVRVYLPLTIR